MKISSVTIQGMHKIALKKYEFDENGLSYLVGANGQGKSTVLKAIQLGILGYIPGENKNVSQIFRHCNNSSQMMVKVEFSDGTHIQRTWKKSGSSIKSEVDSDATDLAAQIEDIELPIFNFNELLGMTSNKLKDWFIDFLPSAENEIDWEYELNSALDDLTPMKSNLISETVSDINNIPHSNPIDWVNKVNEKFKEAQKYYKEEVNRVNNTIQMLIYHDDVACSPDPEEEISNIQKECDALIQERGIVQNNRIISRRNSQIKEQIAALNPVEITEEDTTKVQELRAEISKLNEEIQNIESKSSELYTKSVNIRAEISTKNKIIAGKGICPYTAEACESILSLNEKLSKEIEELNSTLKLTSDEIGKLNVDKQNKTAEVNSKTMEIQKHNSKVQAAQNYNTQVANFNSLLQSEVEIDSKFESEEAYTEEIRKLQDQVLKIRENINYNSLIDKFTQEKYVNENLVEVYKCWVKRTDPNGLPTELAKGPFQKLKEEMDSYLKEFFVKEDIECWFVLKQKANSFSLGILREGQYIPYELLSSGEKTMYAVALMMCIIQSSSSELKLLLADDIVDHLDSDNAIKFFERLANSKSTQIILAGVVPNSEGTCIEV